MMDLNRGIKPLLQEDDAGCASELERMPRSVQRRSLLASIRVIRGKRLESTRDRIASGPKSPLTWSPHPAMVLRPLASALAATLLLLTPDAGAVVPAAPHDSNFTFIDCSIENGSPLHWDSLPDGTLLISPQYDHERDSPNRAAGHWHFRLEGRPGFTHTLIKIDVIGRTVEDRPPEITQRGGLGKTHQLFGEQLQALLDELNHRLVA